MSVVSECIESLKPTKHMGEKSVQLYIRQAFLIISASECCSQACDQLRTKKGRKTFNMIIQQKQI